MAITIAVAGKGGTGKTTFTALVARYLVQHHRGTVLAVDADPNANLNEALGLEVKNYIADILEDSKDPKTVPAGMTKDRFIEYRLSQAIVETAKVDLLVMGRPPGPGCYCFPNDLLRKQMETLRDNYDFLLLDNEAGLEQISRGTIRNVDHLFAISDASARGVRSTRRVKELVDSLKSKVSNLYLVVTKVTDAGLAALQTEIDRTGIPLAGIIPLDDQLVQYDLEGKPLFDLPDSAPAVLAVNKILDNILL